MGVLTSVAAALQMMDTGECDGADGLGLRHGNKRNSGSFMAKLSRLDAFKDW